MLTEFSIGNYQAFSNPQRVPIKPITLIFGPNSAGKSALLRSLLLSKDAILHGTLTKTDVSHELHPGKPTNFLRNSVSPLQVTYTLGDRSADGTSQQRQMTFGWSQKNNQPGIETDSMKLLEQGKEVAAYQRRRRTGLLHPQFITPELVTTEQAQSAKTDRENLQKWLMDRALLVSQVAIPGSKITDFTVGEYDPELSFDTWLHELLAANDKPSLTVFANQEDVFRNELKKRFSDFYAELSVELKDMAYHEPLRPVPKQITEESKNDSALSEWWRLASDPDLLVRVNRWFAGNPHTKNHRLTFDRLLPVSNYADLVAQLGGEITAYQALEAALDAKIESEGLCEDHMYSNGVWNDDDPSMCDFDSKEEALEASYHYLMDEGEYGWRHFRSLTASGDLDSALAFLLSGVNALKKTYASKLEAPWKHLVRADIYFEDVSTKAKILPSNLGVGFSQMIPFVSSALSSESRLIAIEQPELHVHPALQTELADLFIQSVKERGNRFLIETHSEHLILRVMRRIRETFECKLPEGKQPITVDDVCVLYVEPGENGSIVREMPLNERGELIKGWPGGFFEEALNEMF
jgi:ABC-type ATPase involved in cell division